MVKIHFKTKDMRTFELFSPRNFKTSTEARAFLNAFRRRNKKVVKDTGARFTFKSSAKRKITKRKKVTKRKTAKRKVTKRKTTRKKTTKKMVGKSSRKW